MSYKKRKCKTKLTEREIEFMRLVNPYGDHNFFIKEVCMIMNIRECTGYNIKRQILKRFPETQKVFDDKKSIRSVTRKDKKRFKVVDGVQQVDALDIAVSLDASMYDNILEKF